ncbi:MAG: hypothetical protein ACI9T9_002347 [Oleiphilaceae bacterium]|jgi:hypothetical protein
MDISQSLVNYRPSSPLQTNRQVNPEPAGQQANQSTRPSDAVASQNIDSSAIKRRAELLQADRVQRVNDLESAPLKIQNAVNSYQQTIEATKNFEQGELVGVDLFV